MGASARQNVKWVALSQFGRTLIHLLALLILARLVSPADYGLMAMATVVTNFAMLIRDLGTSAAVIQREELDEATLNFVFWLNIGVGIGLAALLALLAPVIALYGFQNSALTPVLWWLALAFPLASGAALNQALLERASAFSTIARIDVLSATVGLILAILAALHGAGVYSLVIQTLATILMSSIQLWLTSRWKPRGSKPLDRQTRRGLFGFSGNLTAFNLINYFSRNADAMLIGHHLGASILGAYSLANRIMLFPIQSLSFVSSRSLYPIMSRQQSQLPEMRTLYLHSLSVIATLVSPLMLGLAMVSDEFVRLAFGETWNIVSILLQWLAPTAIVQAVVATTGTVFMALGRTRTMMWLGVLGSLLYIAAFWIGVQFNIEVFVQCVLIVSLINAIPALGVTLHHLQGSVSELLKAMMAPIAAASGMALLLSLISPYLNHRLAQFGWGLLLTKALVGILVYCILMLIFGRSHLRRVIGKPLHDTSAPDEPLETS